MQPRPQNDINIRENYAENTTEDFVLYVTTGVKTSPNIAAFATDLVKLQPVAIWRVLQSITQTVLPKPELYDVVMRAVHLPTFTKYIEHAFCKFIPCESIVPPSPEGTIRSLAAVQIACSYHHLLPQALIVKLQELRELAAFYKDRPWGRQIRDIIEVHRPPPSDEPESEPEPEPTLWDRLFRSAFVPDDFLVGDAVQQQQVEKLARLAREIVSAYVPDQSAELQQLLIIAMPAIVEAIFTKPIGTPAYLRPADKAGAIRILGRLITFFQKYSHAKSQPGDVASRMFADLGHFNVATLVMDKISGFLDTIRHPAVTSQIKLALIEYVRVHVDTIIDNYLNAQYVQRLIERLIEIDFGESPASSGADATDDEYSYQLGTLLSELFNHVVKCGSGRGLSSYLLGASLLKFSKTNGDAMQQAHAEFVAGTCSMKPLIIAHHLAVQRVDGKLVPTLHMLSGRHTTNLHDAIMRRIHAAAATSIVARFALQLSSGLLSAIISSLLEIAADTRLIHIFVAVML